MESLPSLGSPHMALRLTGQFALTHLREAGRVFPCLLSFGRGGGTPHLQPGVPASDLPMHAFLSQQSGAQLLGSGLFLRVDKVHPWLRGKEDQCSCP
jgi:hypothetical protein